MKLIVKCHFTTERCLRSSPNIANKDEDPCTQKRNEKSVIWLDIIAKWTAMQSIQQQKLKKVPFGWILFCNGSRSNRSNKQMTFLCAGRLILLSYAR